MILPDEERMFFQRRQKIPSWQLQKLGHLLQVCSGGGLLIPSNRRNECVVYIESGKAAALYTDPRGCEILVSYLYAGDLVDETTAASYLKGTRLNIIAVNTCTVRRIPYDDFYSRARRRPDIYSIIISQMAERLLRTTRRLLDVGMLEVSHRIVNMLTDLTEAPDAKSHPKGYLISTTRQELGKMVGCTRESAGRAVKKLEALGFMEAKGKQMIVYYDGYDRLKKSLAKKAREKELEDK